MAARITRLGAKSTHFAAASLGLSVTSSQIRRLLAGVSLGSYHLGSWLCRRLPMKNLVTLLATLGLVVGATVSTFAGDAPKSQAECKKAHMPWDAAKKTCS